MHELYFDLIVIFWIEYNEASSCSRWICGGQRKLPYVIQYVFYAYLRYSEELTVKVLTKIIMLKMILMILRAVMMKMPKIMIGKRRRDKRIASEWKDLIFSIYNASFCQIYFINKNSNKSNSIWLILGFDHGHQDLRTDNAIATENIRNLYIDCKDSLD